MINRNEKHCVFFDWDGTLRVGKTISDANKEALAKLKEAGHYIFLNTGRSKGFIPEIAFECADWDGIIAGSCYVELGGEIILNRYLSEETLRYAKDFHDKTGFLCLLEGVFDRYALGEHNEFIKVNDNYDEFLSEGIDNLQITKLNVITDLRGMDNVNFPGCYMVYQGDYTEICLDGYDKSTGIKLICDRLGVPLERTVSFGDSRNDIDMLKCTGVSVIMPDSPKDIYKYADFHVESMENGVAEGINKLFFE